MRPLFCFVYVVFVFCYSDIGLILSFSEHASGMLHGVLELSSSWRDTGHAFVGITNSFSIVGLFSTVSVVAVCNPALQFF